MYLATRLPSGHQKMFAPCRLAMQWDSRLALFLLPHLLLRVGLHGDNAILEAIQEEMNSVVCRLALEEPNVLQHAQVPFLSFPFLSPFFSHEFSERGNATNGSPNDLLYVG